MEPIEQGVAPIMSPEPAVEAQVTPITPRLPTSFHYKDDGFPVCEAIAFGRTVESAMSERGFGSATPFYRALMVTPELSQLFQLARQISSFSLDDEALTKVRALEQAPGSREKIQATNLLLTHLRWTAAKRNPQVFSDKAEVKVTVPISITTSLDLGSSAANGTKEFPNIYDLTATGIEEIPYKDLTDSEINSMGDFSGNSADTIDTRVAPSFEKRYSKAKSPGSRKKATTNGPGRPRKTQSATKNKEEQASGDTPL